MDEAQATNVQGIIEQARSGATPSTWNVWSLRRDIIGREIWQWAGIGIFGLVLLVPALRIMIPDNFTGDSAKEVISIILLTLLCYMTFGAIFLFGSDLQRLLKAGEYLLVMTPDDYIKVEPRHITHVPMDQIEHITLNGVQQMNAATAASESTDPAFPTALWSVNRFMGSLRRKPKVARSLAFLDKRTNATVIVGRDNSFDDLVALEEVLRLHVNAKERQERTRPR